MSIALRAKAMLANPSAEWTAIEREPGDPAYLLSRYAAVLALIPAACSFIGTSLIGVVAADGTTLRTPVFNGLFGAVFGYVATCVSVLLLGLFINLVAPAFGGRRDFDSTFKLAVYSFTPVWLAGIFLLVPGLYFLVLTGCYGAYILWLGLPRLTKSPERQALSFTTVIVVCAFALAYLAAHAQRVIFGTPGL
jgi:hypothetical protein